MRIRDVVDIVSFHIFRRSSAGSAGNRGKVRSGSVCGVERPDLGGKDWEGATFNLSVSDAILINVCVHGGNREIGIFV